MEITLILFIILLALRIPIALVLGIISSIFIMLTGNLDVFTSAPQRLFSSVAKFDLLAIPLFMLAGELMNSGGITIRLVRFAQAFVGHFRGGLAYVNVLANAFLASIIGSAAAQIGMMSKIMVPAMEKEGYKREFAAATTAAAGLLGPIIPPSMIFIIYAVGAGTSIGAMFLGGILPGILLAGAFIGLIALVGHRERWPQTAKQSWKQRFTATVNVLPAMLVPAIMFAGIISGAFTPTEAASVACVIAILIGFFLYRELKFRDVQKIMVNTATGTAIVTMLIAMASILGWVLTFERLPQLIAQWMIDISQGPLTFLLLVNILLIILGMFIEGIAIIIILTPILVPILPQLGIDPVHFGVIICLNVVIGMLTPPVGSGIFLACSLAKVKFEDFVKSAFPFVVASIVVLLLITYFPQIVLWIPSNLTP